MAGGRRGTFLAFPLTLRSYHFWIFGAYSNDPGLPLEKLGALTHPYTLGGCGSGYSVLGLENYMTRVRSCVYFLQHGVIGKDSGPILRFSLYALTECGGMVLRGRGARRQVVNLPRPLPDLKGS